MILFRTHTVRKDFSYRKRYDCDKFTRWVITHTIDSIRLMYSVDTWYLPGFERILIYIKDYVRTPESWGSLVYWALYNGDELVLYYIYVYYNWFFINSLIYTWQWRGWTLKQILNESNFGVHFEDMKEKTTITQANLKFLKAHLMNPYYELPYAFIFWGYFLHMFTPLYWSTLSRKMHSGQEYFKQLKRTSILAPLPYLRSTYKIFSGHKLLNYIVRQLIVIYNSIRLLVPTAGFFDCKKHPTQLLVFKTWQVNKQPLLSVFNKSVELVKFKINQTIDLDKVYKNYFIKPIAFTQKRDVCSTSALLRKNRIFTKSKYSRSRQYCKNIVLLGLLINIILVFGLNSGYYAILINTGYCITPLYASMIVYSVFIWFRFKLWDIFNV